MDINDQEAKEKDCVIFIRCDQQRIEYNTQSEHLMIEFSFEG